MHHDAFFRAVFRRRAWLAAMLRSVLPAELVGAVDWRTLRPCPARFLDHALGSHEGDMVWMARDRDGQHHHVFVVEHKSRLRRHAVLQPLRYVVHGLEHWAAQDAGQAALPRIHAVVVYHGRPLSRGAREQARSLPQDAECTGHASDGSLRFRTHFVDLSRTCESQLLLGPEPAPVRLVWCLLQHMPSMNPDASARALQRWHRVAAEVFRGDHWASELEACIEYLFRRTKLNRPTLLRLTQHWGRNPRGVVMYTADKLIREGEARGLRRGLERGLERGMERGRAQGIEEGKERGLVRGIVQGARRGRQQLLVRLLRARFGSVPRRILQRIARATERQLDGWAVRVLDAPSLAAVFARRG